MYETLMHTLRGFLSTGTPRFLILLSLAFLVVAFAAYASPAFRDALAKMRESKGWRGIVADLGTGVAKLLFIFIMARLLITALNFQADIFEQGHGRITERNRSAVLMKWGYPHEQRELSVTQMRKRTWVTRQLLVKDETGNERVLSESYWKDEEVPIQAVRGRMPTLLSTREEERDVLVPQKSVVSADVEVTVRNNPRLLGNAYYAGYDDLWKMTYVVANESQWETAAAMSIPLPARTGFFDKMYLRVDGRDALESAETRDVDITWSVKMSPGSRKSVEFGYSSRGLEHLRYIPRRMTQTGHYRVAMTVAGIPPAKLDYPIGSMPPAENLADVKGDPYILTWKLDNAMTSYDIGVKLPLADQPAYHFADLLRQAPVGFIMFLALLIVPALVGSLGIRLEVIGILSVLYCLHYTFMGRLADVISGFALPFLLSAVLAVLVVAWFRLRGKSGRLLPVQDVVVFAVMTVLYPLAVVDADRTATWMQFFYLGIVIYTCALLMGYSLRRREQ